MDVACPARESGYCRLQVPAGQTGSSMSPVAQLGAEKLPGSLDRRERILDGALFWRPICLGFQPNGLAATCALKVPLLPGPRSRIYWSSTHNMRPRQSRCRARRPPRHANNVSEFIVHQKPTPPLAYHVGVGWLTMEVHTRVVFCVL
jgi:hypothetical protein